MRSNALNKNSSDYGKVGAGIVNIKGALTLTADFSGSTLVFSDADGATVTLPAATGSGNSYEFFVGVTVTSNNDIIQVANANDTMDGWIHNLDNDTSDALAGWVTVAASDTITLDGSTTGGILGDWIKLVDILPNQWMVHGMTTGTGTVATPFSAAVS
jgi:hypothetical protein